MEDRFISPAQKRARKSSKSRTGKKELMITSGIELFLRHGYENVAVEDITTASNTSKGTFYYYFETKEDLLKAITKGLVDDSSLDKELEQFQGSSLEKIKFFVRQYAEMMEVRIGREFNKLWAKIVLETENSDRLKQDLNKLLLLFNEGVEKGEFRASQDYTRIGKMIIDYIYGSSFTWDLDEQGMHILETTDLFCESLDLVMQKYLVSR